MNKKFSRIHYKLHNAIRGGKVERGLCEVCGTSKNIHGHHDDYDKPLQVRWLCKKHHLKVHGRGTKRIGVNVEIKRGVHTRLKVRAAREELTISELLDKLLRIK